VLSENASQGACLSFCLSRAVCYCFIRGCGYIRSGCFMLHGVCGDRDRYVDLGFKAPPSTGSLDMESPHSQMLVIVMLSVPMHPAMRVRVVEIAKSGGSQRILYAQHPCRRHHYMYTTKHQTIPEPRDSGAMIVSRRHDIEFQPKQTHDRRIRK
jgi:hypothetical protein